MPESFGTYELIQKIAQGGMAEIFLATREADLGGFEKKVAIKRIFRHLTGRQETVNMFFDEARIAATLQHPNIVQVYDLGEVDGYFYIAMEFVQGTDLRRVCKRGLEDEHYLPIDLAAHVVAQTAAGLHYAHTRTDRDGTPRNIVHRDISPQNILLTMDGHVKICDFGIAKAENRLARTRTGQFKGKLSYMSPEQFNGEEVDARSDVFNLGIVLYEITLARRLFDAKTDFERMRQIANAHVTQPSEVRSDFPTGLEQIILKALRHDPDDRFQSAEQMQIALEDWIHDRGAKVGSVQVGNYLAELFPELEAGIPENMAQVEFPGTDRDDEQNVSEAQRNQPAPGLHERSSPRDDNRRVEPGQKPEGPSSHQDASGVGSSETSGTYGTVTVDPSQQPDRETDSTGAGAEEEPTKQVDREAIQETIGGGGSPGGGTEPSDGEHSGRGAPGGATQVTGNPNRRAGESSEVESGSRAASEPRDETSRPEDESSRSPDDVETERRDRRQLSEGSSSGFQTEGPRDREDPPADSAAANERAEPGRSRRDHDTGPRGGGASGRSASRSSSPQGPPSRRGPPPAARSDGPPTPPPARGHSGGGEKSRASDSAASGGDRNFGPEERSDRGGGAPGASGDEGLEPDSALQRTWQRSVDIVTNGDDGFTTRQQRITGVAIFVAGVIGTGIYIYAALEHGTEHDIEETAEEQQELAAKVEDATSDVDRTVDTPTVAKKLTTEPEGAHVVVNAAPVEEPTPTSVPLVEGEKNELYLYKTDHKPKRVVIESPAEQLPTYELEDVPEDETSTVQIKADPEGAAAFLDGERVGTTPLKIEDVALAGRHFLRLEKEGKESYFGLFEMRQNKEKPTIVVPKMANSGGANTGPYCEVVYDFLPQGSTVKANGEVQGRSRVAVKHTCGQYLDITAWKEEYRDGRHYVHLRRPGKYLFKAELEQISREPGELSVEVADDMRVFIGSNGYGKGPVENLELRSGEYNAVFQPASSSERFRKTLEVRPNETTEYEFEIEGGSGTLERTDK